MNRTTIGRIVRFINEGGDERAAIITIVWSEETVNLFVFPTDSLEAGASGVRRSIVYDEQGLVNTWHWPERT